MSKAKILLTISFIGGTAATAQPPLQQFEFVNFSKVNITDNFWKPKIDKVATTTLAACIYQTEIATPRLRNFEKVARKKGEKHEGIFYDDSDVFKALEAMAYSLKTHPDTVMERKCDEWINKIAAAQQPDGYLNTYFTLTDISKRYTDMSMHEDYNCGHLIEAAVAYYNATGKRQLLDVAIRWANHFNSLFGPGKRDWVTGHQELELALVKLYKVTKDAKYLRLADWLLNERGHRLAKGYTWTDWKDTAYAQDLVPVKQQTQITGHAVRAMYMYTGAADVAALTGDEGYMKAMKAVWEDVVYRNMYITGGIGSAGSNEGFTKDYDLPNEQAYCETCASVGMVFWNQRMNALTGESMYMDVLEKSLYNGALDGLSLSGDHFFYGNPLASSGQHYRREWFGTACCPANIARLVASLGNYIYAGNGTDIWVQLFVGSNTVMRSGTTDVAVTMQTNYPWDGKVSLSVDPEKKQRFAMRLRVPGFARNETVPGDLYSNADSPDTNFNGSISVNGKAIAYRVEKGYAVIEREWKKGDVVSYDIPLEIQKAKALPALKFDEDRVALTRGPLVYCIEGADNNGRALNIVVPEETRFTATNERILNEPVVALQASVPVTEVAANGTGVLTAPKKITAIPYYTWANRGQNEMQVWIPVKIKSIRLN